MKPSSATVRCHSPYALEGTEAERLIEKLLRVEAQFTEAATAGERQAAANPTERLWQRWVEHERDDETREFKVLLFGEFNDRHRSGSAL
jgi:hypothetical protein